jgi:hypothetical protein
MLRKRNACWCEWRGRTRLALHARYGAQTTIDSQAERATTGLTPDGVAGRPVDSSRFPSHADQLEAINQATALRNVNGANFQTFDMRRAIGEGFGKGTDDLIRTTNVTVFFRNGLPCTAYPSLRGLP